MNEGRLPKEFRDRCKAFGSRVIQLLVGLPKIGMKSSSLQSNCFVRERPLQRKFGKLLGPVRMPSLWPNWGVHCRRLTKANFG